MERARILRWRLEQQAAQVQQAEEELSARATARLVRPLINQPLAQWAQELGGALHNISEIPTSRIENDRRSVLVGQLVRDHLTTKAFTVDTINGVFLIGIGDRQVELDLICPRYRRRGELICQGDDQQWFPPGDYTDVYLLAQARWRHDDDAPRAIDYFFVQAREQIPAIRAYSDAAALNTRRRWRIQLGRKIGVGVAMLLYLAVAIAVVAWFLVMLYMLLRYGPDGLR